ncbi:MAG: FliM/FliN family flagellar motor switch protein [Rhizobiaceae bacterium]|nr:FliM/FliN family flagellar motor switch protein [Rhizobiaceae bacterium]
MADHDDQSAMSSDVELPDLDAPQEDIMDAGSSDLPDLGIEPEMGGGDLPDLNEPATDSFEMNEAGDLPDLGAGLEMDNEIQDDLSTPMEAENFQEPQASSTSGDFQELPASEAPKMAGLADFGSGDSILAFKKIQGIKVRVQVMLGETKLSVSQLAGLKKGDFVQLDTKVGETVNIFANGALIARGEIAVEDEEAPRFGITLTEIVDSSIASS